MFCMTREAFIAYKIHSIKYVQPHTNTNAADVNFSAISYWADYYIVTL